MAAYKDEQRGTWYVSFHYYDWTGKNCRKLLILDPIQAYLGGGMDMNRANEARDMTKKLATLAEKYQCAIRRTEKPPAGRKGSF